MRIAMPAFVVALLSFAALANAQSTSDAGQKTSENPAPRLNLTLPTIRIVPERRPLGPLTLNPPQTNGQIVSVSVPIGELVVRGFGAMKKAQHRRSERKARAQVQKELAEFLARQAANP